MASQSTKLMSRMPSLTTQELSEKASWITLERLHKQLMITESKSLQELVKLSPVPPRLVRMLTKT